MIKNLAFFGLLSFFLTASPAFLKAQDLNKINEASFFSTKFNKEKVWDVQRGPVTPTAGQNWKISGLKPALDLNKTPIDWGNGRYVMFSADVDNANTSNSLKDDINGKSIKYNVSLKLYESNGSLVKVISKWGNIIGIGTVGFLYEAEGKTGIFFSIFNQTPAKVFQYAPSIVKAGKLSELPFVRIKSCTGKVKWFDAAKGYGFINVNGGPVVLVHYTGIEHEGFKGLQEGQEVYFDLTDGPKGPQAVKVNPVQ